MKYLVVLFVLSISMFAQNIEKKVDISKTHLKSIHNKELSKEEKAFLKYKEELEKENQKLEDDGFCSCNNS